MLSAAQANLTAVSNVYVSGGITAKDIQRVAERMLRTKPSVAAYGKLGRLPDLDTVQSKLLERPSLKSKLRSMF